MTITLFLLFILHAIVQLHSQTLHLCSLVHPPGNRAGALDGAVRVDAQAYRLSYLRPGLWLDVTCRYICLIAPIHTYLQQIDRMQDARSRLEGILSGSHRISPSDGAPVSSSAQSWTTAEKQDCGCSC